MPYDVDAMRKRAQESRGGIFWKPSQGKNKIRVLPGVNGKSDPDAFFGSFYEHRVGTDHGGAKFFRCLANTADPCPACTCATLFSTSESSALQDAARDLRAKIRYNVNVITDDEGQVKVWSPSAARIEDMIELLEDDEWGDFTAENDGYCLTVTKRGEKLQTRYKITASRTTMKLPEDWEEQAHDLTKGGDLLSAKEIRNILVDKYEDAYEGLGQSLLMKKSGKKGKKHRREADEEGDE